MPPKSERAQNLGTYIEKEVETVKAGEKILYPQRDLAWILGLLSGGGYIRKGAISLSASKNEALLKEFKNVGERLFKINATEGIYATFNGIEVKCIRFSSTNISTSLGDLRNKNWAQTILDKHLWILENENHVWSFLEGYFETSGTAQISGKRLTFYTGNNNSANLLADLLSKLNIQNSKIIYGKKPERIRGIQICNLKDTQKIASQIHSVNSKKEKSLEFFRSASFGNSPNKVLNDIEVIREWSYLKLKLGHAPTTHEINYLRAQEETKFSHIVYSRRFGDGRFSSARENLEKILSEQEKTNKSHEHVIHPGEEVPINL